MLSLKSALVALVGVALVGPALSACRNRPLFELGGGDDGDDGDDDEPDDVDAHCEAREPTPMVERPGALTLLTTTGGPGWRYETLAPDGDGVIAAITSVSGAQPGRLERWTDGEPTPALLAGLPSGHRVLGIAPGPGAIYMQMIEASPGSSGKRGVLEVRDGEARMLHAYDDLAGYPALFRSKDALFAQARSGAFVRFPMDGGTPAVITVSVQVGTLAGEALYLARGTTDDRGERPIERLLVERMDLATGFVAPVAQPFCVDARGDGAYYEASAMVVHAGVPYINTRRSIASLDASGARVDPVLIAGDDLRGVRADEDGIYFFSGHRGDGMFAFYRLPHDGGPAEVVARFEVEDPAVEVSGLAVLPGAMYIGLTSPDVRAELWRVALD